MNAAKRGEKMNYGERESGVNRQISRASGARGEAEGAEMATASATVVADLTSLIAASKKVG